MLTIEAPTVAHFEMTPGVKFVTTDYLRKLLFLIHFSQLTYSIHATEVSLRTALGRLMCA